MPLFFWFDYSLGAMVEICPIFSLFFLENLRQPQFSSEITRALVSACFDLAENSKMLSVTQCWCWSICQIFSLVIYSETIWPLESEMMTSSLTIWSCLHGPNNSSLEPIAPDVSHRQFKENNSYDSKSAGKGQVISERNCDVLNFPKKRRKDLTNFFPSI